MKIEVQDPRKKPVDPSKISFKHVSAESKKNKPLNVQKVGTEEEERETPPDQIITAQKFTKVKNSASKGSSPYDIDGPSYIDPQTTQHLGDLNLKNQISGINAKSSEVDSVDEFDSNKKGFNKQIGTKELQDLIKEEASSGHSVPVDPNTTKAKDAPELEFKKLGGAAADGSRELNRVTSYNNITPLNEDLSDNDKKLKQEKDVKK